MLWRMPTRARDRQRLATLAVDQIAGAPLDPLGHAVELTEPLDAASRRSSCRFQAASPNTSSAARRRPMRHRHDAGRGDGGAAQDAVSIPVIEPSERIRATVIGAPSSPCR